jgi:hypothetical protein
MYFILIDILPCLLRFAVSPNILRSNLQSLESMLLHVPLLIGLDTQDPYTRNIFSSSIDPQSNWIQRISKEIFDIPLSVTEAKALVTCLVSSSQGLSIDPQILVNYWSRSLTLYIYYCH